MQKLKNKVAVITGGSSGIGLGIAKRFVQEGAKVAITGRNQQTIDKALKEIGPNAIGVQGDVSKPDDLSRIYQTVSTQLGKIDALIVNAGVYILGPLASFSEEQFDKVSDINFKGAFFSVQKALSSLNDGAAIVMLSSTALGKGFPNHAAYSATKAAIRSLARSFSVELLDRRIRVNTLSPGPTDTPVFNTVATNADEAKAMKEAMGNFTPLKRVASSEEIAAAALYLVSDETAFMLGAELLLDGGLRDL